MMQSSLPLSMRAALVVSLLSSSIAATAEPALPRVSKDVVFRESGGVVAVEAEHFAKQTKTGTRAWYLVTKASTPEVTPDGDPPHVGGASGGAYLEILPDTRRTHGDKLIRGENFSPEPGKLAVLSYRVHFETTGRYYVWVRAHSTGSEDNGLHVGLDGEWPATGQRLQWCQGKKTWRWESKQRTQEQHCGVPHLIYLDVDEAGEHTVSFSMREDGFEFDKWLMTTDRDLARPTGIGPKTAVRSGTLPKAFPFVAAPAAAALEPVAEPSQPLVQPRGTNGDGSVAISGELRQWHPVTLTLDGPFAHERDSQPNPFRDHRMVVTFRHENGTLQHAVPGYFAADGDAGETSAESGTKWRAHLSPDRPGKWTYEVAFHSGRDAAIDGGVKARPVSPYHGKSGSFTVAETDKTGVDLRGKGRLEYVGRRYLRFAGTKEYFLKMGPDAPETLLGYADFDGIVARKDNVPLKTWQPHVRDWNDGDPTWQDGKGKGLIGAVNYLSEQGCNTISFLPYNAGGDGDNVWPHVSHGDKRHFDCSKLDQWGVVFDHAQTKGLYLHFKMQEQENDDNVRGRNNRGNVPAALNGGDLGPERKLYCRELVARFGHALALNWNLGEENTQSAEQQRAMAAYIREVDPYDHHVVVHTFPQNQEEKYRPLLGERSVLTGASLQNHWNVAHQRTLQWIRESEKAGKPWVCCNDEQGPASLGVPPDPGYAGHDGIAREVEDGKPKGKPYDLHDIRKHCLWGTLMAGGAGVEYYFGYKLPQNDLVCEDFRSRERSWKYGRIAVGFFHDHEIPVTEMSCRDELVGNAKNDNARYCLAKPGDLYLVYLPTGGTTSLDLAKANGAFDVAWFNPRDGGELARGSVARVTGGSKVDLGKAPAEPDQDWLVVVRRR